MKSISERIKEALDLRGMKQIDLVEKTGIGKSSISTYLSGEYEPKQRNIYKIAKALDVSEPWLMGFDVPMERKETYNIEEPVQLSVAEESCQYYKIETKETKILNEFNKLNETGKNEAVNRVTELTYIPQYTDFNVIPINSKKKKYEPTEEDIKSLVARNGRKLTREEAIEFISAMYSDDEDED